MIQVEYLPIVLTGIGIMASILYYASVLRNANKTRETQLFYGIMNQMNQPYFIDAWNTYLETEFQTYEDFMKIMEDPEAKRKLMVLGVYWEGLGVLVREKLIPIHLVAKFITNWTRTYWERQQPFIYEFRKRENVPRSLSEVEYLYNELMT